MCKVGECGLTTFKCTVDYVNYCELCNNGGLECTKCRAGYYLDTD